MSRRNRWSGRDQIDHEPVTIEDIMADLDPGWLEWQTDLEGVEDVSASPATLRAISNVNPGSARPTAKASLGIDDGSSSGEDEAVGL